VTAAPEPDRPVLVRAAGVCLAYGLDVVLRDVDLEVRAGEYWFFLGRNGAGKTTLMHALLGMHPASAGMLTVAPRQGGRERVGFVPQRCDLSHTVPTTVREFVRLGLVGTRAGKAERAERLRWALAQVELAALAGRSFWALSGGQRQRALVARALVRRPAILMLDEPMTGLDLAAEARVLDLLAGMHRLGLAVVYVTHKVAVARRYGTHVALFCGDALVTGRTHDVLTPGNLERAFGIEVDAWDAHAFSERPPR